MRVDKPAIPSWPSSRHAVLAPNTAEHVLLVGVGTGADLTLLPPGVRALGVDLSAAMLARAKARLPLVAVKAPRAARPLPL